MLSSCISGLRFLPNDTLRAEGFLLSHSIEKIHYIDFLIFFFPDALYSRDYHMLLRYQILVDAKDISHCDYVVDM